MFQKSIHKKNWRRTKIFDEKKKNVDLYVLENVLARKQLEIDASTGPSTKCRHNNIEIMPNHLLSCRRFERRRSFSKWRVAGVHANEPNPESRSKIQKSGITHERGIAICKLRLCFFHQRATCPSPPPFFYFSSAYRESVRLG